MKRALFLASVALTLPLSAFSADQKISAMTDIATVTGAMQLPIVNGTSTNYSTTPLELWTYDLTQLAITPLPVADGGTGVTTKTGTGSVVLSNSPTLVTPTLGAATASGLTLSSITGSTQCLQVNSSGVVAGAGTTCGGSGSPRFIKLGGATLDFHLTSDQPITLTAPGLAVVTGYVVTNCQTSLNAATPAAGAFYAAASKAKPLFGGAAGTTWVKLVATTDAVFNTVQIVGGANQALVPTFTTSSSTSFYLSLTTGNTTNPSLCDVTVYGIDLS